MPETRERQRQPSVCPRGTHTARLEHLTNARRQAEPSRPHLNENARVPTEREAHVTRKAVSVKVGAPAAVRRGEVGICRVSSVSMLRPA